MDPRGVTREMIVEQAVDFAKLLGWVIDPVDCHMQPVESVTPSPSGRPGRYHRWKVMMAAQPAQNPRIRTPMPVSCTIEWLGERLCATQFSEPSDRTRYLKEPGGTMR